MKIFGNKKEFSIAFNPYLEQYANDPDVIADPDEYLLGGNIYFWVKDKNLFAFKDWGPDATYGYYTLEYLLDFFTNFLIFQLSDVPFPIKTKSTNAIDMLEEIAFVKSNVEDELQAYGELDWDEIDLNVRDKIWKWIEPRTFLGNRAGTFLPNIMVRRVGDNIELSWGNNHPHDDGENKFYFLHKKGVEYINVKIYKNVVIQFCFAFIEHIKEKEPELAEKYRKNLQKAIDVQL